LGNVRPCNHSATVLGNIRDAGFWEMVDGPVMKAYLAARPEFCADCEIVSECQCGCKAAAEVCCGSPEHLDPFVAAFAKRRQ
jgi:radical SAM protein with 4Fe4S-binding SPASM domain